MDTWSCNLPTLCVMRDLYLTSTNPMPVYNTYIILLNQKLCEKNHFSPGRPFIHLQIYIH